MRGVYSEVRVRVSESRIGGREVSAWEMRFLMWSGYRLLGCGVGGVIERFKVDGYRNKFAGK